MMKEAKFTKGPWILIEGDMCQKECVVTTEDREINSKGPVCELDIYFDGEHGAEQEANAHLIKASPKMYKFLDDLANGRGTDYPIEKLLAEARGEK